MRSNNEIERDVREELAYSPGLASNDIAVSVKDGIVTLTGFTHSYVDKYEAERAAKRVSGVLGVVNDIEVRLEAFDQRPDPEIAREAVAALKSRLPLSWENVKVTLNDGWITLEGQVEWQFQKEAAERAVRNIKGVKGVTNSILVRPKAEPQEIKKKIEAALKRSAEIDANRIQVESHGGEVILKGTVRSWIEREEAERAAWAAPGVTRVEDRISVQP